MGQWPFHRRVCLKTIASVRGPAAEMYSLCLFERIHGIGSLVEICCSFFCEQVGFKRFALFLVENCQEHTVIYRVSCTSRFSIFENRLNTNVFFCVHQGKKGFGAITGNEEGETQGNISTRSKIETKTRNKCNFLHVAALWNRTARRYHSFSPQRWPKHCGPVSRQGSLPFHRVGLKVMVSLWGPETCLSFRTYFYGIVFKICGSFFFGEEVGKDCFKLLNDRGDQDCTWTLVSHKNVWTNKWPIRCRCHLTSMTTWSCLFYVSPVSTVIVSMSSCVGHVFVHLSGCIGHCQHYIDIIFAM